MDQSIFKELPTRYSDFITFAERKTALAADDDAPEATEGESSAPKPKLSYIRVELDRVRVGMSDFIIRVATPEYDGIKSNTVLSIRGNRSMTKLEQVRKLAKVVGKEMSSRKDETHKWSDLDTEHLANMLAVPLKFFAMNTNLDTLRFTTEALM